MGFVVDCVGLGFGGGGGWLGVGFFGMNWLSNSDEGLTHAHSRFMIAWNNVQKNIANRTWP